MRADEASSAGRQGLQEASERDAEAVVAGRVLRVVRLRQESPGATWRAFAARDINKSPQVDDWQSLFQLSTDPVDNFVKNLDMAALSP